MGYPDPYRFETWSGAARLVVPAGGGSAPSSQLVRADGVVPETWALTFSAERGFDGLGGLAIVRWQVWSGAGNSGVPLYPPDLPLSEGDRITIPWLAPGQHWAIRAELTGVPAVAGAPVDVACSVAPIVRPAPDDYAAMRYRGRVQ